MDIDQLKKSIDNLRAELEGAGEVGPETRQLLKELDRDLHGPLTARAAVEKEQSGFQKRLESVAADFDGQHPQLAAVLRELGDALARVGI